MRFLAWTMLVVFALVGVFILCEGIRSLVTAIRRRPHLKRVKGTVMTVEKTRETRSSADGQGQMHTYVKFHPVIQFTTELGESVRFRSEMGECYQVIRRWDGTHTESISRYSAGQLHEVLYDPEGKIPPVSRIGSFDGRRPVTDGSLTYALRRDDCSATARRCPWRSGSSTGHLQRKCRPPSC